MRRKLFIILVGSVCLIGIISLILLYWLDPVLNSLRPQISSLITDSIGRSVSVGQIRGRLLPTPAIELSELSVGSNSTESEKIIIGTLRLYPTLQGLLGGPIVIRDIEAHDLTLSVTRLANGAIAIGGIQLTPSLFNLSKQNQDLASQLPGQETATPRPTGAKAKQSPVFQIENIAIARAKLIFNDQVIAPPLHTMVEDITVSLSDITPSGSAEVRFTARLPGSVTSNLSITGTVGDPRKNLPLDVTVAMTALNLDANRDLVRSYSALPKSVKLGGNLNLTLRTRAVSQRLHTRITLNGTGAEIVLPGEFTKPVGDVLSLDLDIDTAVEPFRSAEIRSAEAKLGSLPLHASFTTALSEGGTKKITVRGTIRSQTIALDELRRFFPWAQNFEFKGRITPDLALTLTELPLDGFSGSAVQERLGLQGKINLDGVSFQAPITKRKENGENTGTKRKVEVTDLSGVLLVQEQEIEGQRITLRANGEPLEIDLKVVPSKRGSLRQPNVSAVLRSESFNALPFFTPERALALRSLTLNGLSLSVDYSALAGRGSVSLRAPSANLAGVSLPDLKLACDLAPDRITFPETTLRIFSGFVTLSGSFSRDERQFFTAEVQGKEVNLGELLSIMIKSSTPQVTGTLELLKAQLSGSSRNALGTLIGPISGTVVKGEISHLNLLRDTLKKVDRLPGVQEHLLEFIPEEYRRILSANETAFDTLAFDGAFESQRLELRSIDVEHPLYRMTGRGRITPSGDFALTARLQLASTLTAAMVAKQPRLGMFLDREGGLVIPIVILREGDRTTVLPDISELIKAGAAAAVKDTATRAVEKIAPGLGDAKKVLDKLF